MGVTAQCISAWETGRWSPENEAVLGLYAAVLGVEVHELYDPGTLLEPGELGEPTPQIAVRQGFAPRLVPGNDGRRVVRVGGDTIGNSGP